MKRLDKGAGAAPNAALPGQCGCGGPDPDRDPLGSPTAPRLETDEASAADDLVRLVLSLVETVRQLVERQAIRRVENGVLSDEQIEHLGVTLMQLETRMAELKEHFGLEGEDLTLRLGTVQDLKDVLGDDGPGQG